MQVIALSIIWLYFIPEVLALAPAASLQKKEMFGGAQNYHHAPDKVDLTVLDTEIKYSDLSRENIQDLDDLIEAKKEYGKVFGFKDWQLKEKKFLDDKTERTFLLRGNYKNSSQKTVHFLEVYWANQNKSGQFLLTSQSGEISIDSYKKYLRP